MKNLKQLQKEEYLDFAYGFGHLQMGFENQSLPMIFNSPHSGCHYPARFLAQSRLSELEIRYSEDMQVHSLFEHVLNIGAVLQYARFPRAYLDLNREPFELDPTLFHQRLPKGCNHSSLRVARGLGTIAKLVAEGMNIYKGEIDVHDAFTRVSELYFPYHQALDNIIDSTKNRFGTAVLVDCHSMPSVQPGKSGKINTDLPQIVIGDRYGNSCAVDLSNYAVRIFRELGFTVRRNRPFAGGFVTQNYGRPSQNIHALQIEIRRDLYMDETQMQLTSDFSSLVEKLKLFTSQFITHPIISDAVLNDEMPLPAE